MFSPGPRGNNIGRILLDKDAGVLDYQLLSYSYGDLKDPVIQRLIEEYKNAE